jgi:hypothetical protein
MSFSFSFTIQKLNPFNKNSDLNTMNVDRLESLIPDDISLRVKPDRVFYLAMDFNFIENYRFNDPDFYPLQHMMHKGGGHAHHMFSPQINKISYSAPPSPPLTQYTKDMEVCQFTFIVQFLSKYSLCRMH